MWSGITNLFNIKSMFQTIADTVNMSIGSMDAASFTNKNEYYSKKLTDLFTNTKVNVYVYQSKIANAFTIPGSVNFLGNPFVRKLFVILQYFGSYIFNSVKTLVIILDYIVNITTAESVLSGTNNINYKMEYNPQTKKITSSLKEVTINISSSQIDIQQNDEDAIIGILLHEVGHNAFIFNMVVTDVLSMTLGGVTVFTLYRAIQNGIVNGINVDTKEFEKNHPHLSSMMLKLGFGTLVLLLIALYIVTKYSRRRQELTADEFAIKCGYGEGISRAIKRYNNYAYFRDRGKTASKIKGMNLIDWIYNILNAFGMRIYDIFAKIGLANYQSSTNREKTIDTKTANYDISDKNIDRSANIDAGIVNNPRTFW